MNHSDLSKIDRRLPMNIGNNDVRIEKDVRGNISRVRATINQAAYDSGRNPSSISLIGVSKQQPDDRIEAALKAGLRAFGENRVQEAEGRWSSRKQLFSDLELHLIGPLQTNKARAAVRLFDVIQTVDRPRLAKALGRAMSEEAKSCLCYVQVNIGREEQKAGVSPDETPDFVSACIESFGLNIIGLMCIPPALDAPAPHFAFLKQMADDLDLPNVSMGMSADYPIAVELGATHVRVGSAIFGARHPLKT
jgi:pyridoxal phosphate enzyme (YggS family)